ncbi:MAG: TadE/TadG family type IV pilus assembly protein [Paracraurococcus sp.]|jgi:Flp pilus assembly protein TadG
MSLIRPADPRRGAAAVEFALLVPLLILLFGATAEIVIHMRAWFRLERTAAEVANVASQYDALTATDVAGLFDAAKAIAAPVLAWSSGSGTGKARTTVSVVSGAAGGNSVAWSCSRGDSGLVNQVAGKTALPNGFTVPSGQSVLVVEVINAATPWSVMAAPIFFGTAGPGPVRSYAIVRPRTAALTSVGGACP